jgi:YtcA family
VNARAESPGEIPRLALGRREGDIARRTRWGNGGHGGFGGDERLGSDQMNVLKASARFGLPRLLNLVGLLLLGGCASSHHRVPSIDVFGSYFPAWLLSLLAGVVLTIIAAGAGRLMDLRPSGLRALILSVSLILIFSISIWLWFFAS